jgi:hypothetical protein
VHLVDDQDSRADVSRRPDTGSNLGAQRNAVPDRTAGHYRPDTSADLGGAAHDEGATELDGAVRAVE